MLPSERNPEVELAIGRILRMASRPSQPGDIAEYDRCRAIIMDALEPPAISWAPNYARDRSLGASGA